MRTTSNLDKLLSAAEKELAHLDARRAEILQHIQRLKQEKDSEGHSFAVQHPGSLIAAVTSESAPEEKIALFRRLFRGRDDVYPKRFESTKTGKAGYQPVCQNEWIRPFCKKPKARCGECKNREFLPVTDEVIRNHLRGSDPEGKSIYDYADLSIPMLAKMYGRRRLGYRRIGYTIEE